MVFPVETEERVKRKALDVSSDHLREVVDISRKISQLVSVFVSGDKKMAQELFDDIKKAQNNVDSTRRIVSRELAEIGAILMSREDFLRFTNLTSEIADYCEGIAFRLIQIMERGWKVPKDIKENLIKLSDAVFDTIFKLRETVSRSAFSIGTRTATGCPPLVTTTAPLSTSDVYSASVPVASILSITFIARPPRHRF